MLLFGGVCRRRRAAAARLLPPTFGDTPALLIGCCCCHHDFKLRPPMLCFTVALASLFHAHCLCHCVAEVDGQGVTTGLACSAVGHFFDDAWCTEINVTPMRPFTLHAVLLEKERSEEARARARMR